MSLEFSYYHLKKEIATCDLASRLWNLLANLLLATCDFGNLLANLLLATCDFRNLLATC